MFDVVIVMAGTGVRTGLKTNKVLYPIKGIEVFIYSVRAFLQVAGINNLILVISPSDANLVEEILKKYNLFDKVIMISGGKTRAESVRNGLLETGADKVLIHDAARPLITATDIKKVVDALDKWDAVTLVNPIYDTVKIVQNQKVLKTINRELVKRVITPQGLKKKVITQILNSIQCDDAITDEMVLLEEKFEVYTIETNNPSVKFTTKEDLDLIEYYLTKREEN
jgi:2-C-methyl-D-erythritol 4-phosphate cytidylyltransferase